MRSRWLRIVDIGLVCSALLLCAGASQAESEATQPTSNDAAPGEAIRNLAGEYFHLPQLPTDPIVWRLFPATTLLEGGRLVGLIDAPKSTNLTVELASVQCSRSFLESYFQRAVERDAAVDDRILGTRIAGRSHLSGQVKLAWHTPDQPPGFDLVLRGVCRSQTNGLHEVVTLHNQAETVFEARKTLTWTDAGLVASPAVARAETHSTTVNIDAKLPGVIGQIASRIARDRVAEVRPQADAISSQHAAERIAQGLDARVDHSLAVLRLASHCLPTGEPSGRATQFRATSTADMLRMSLGRLADSETDMPQATMPENCDVSIRMRRQLLDSALADRVVMLVGGALLLQMVANEEEGPAPPAADPAATGPIKTAAAELAAAPLPQWRFARSRDGQWLVVEHYSPPAAAEPSPEQPPRPPVKTLPVTVGRPRTF